MGQGAKAVRQARLAPSEKLARWGESTAIYLQRAGIDANRHAPLIEARSGALAGTGAAGACACVSARNAIYFHAQRASPVCYANFVTPGMGTGGSGRAIQSYLGGDRSSFEFIAWSHVMTLPV
jgi:hypothetical protein